MFRTALDMLARVKQVREQFAQDATKVIRDVTSYVPRIRRLDKDALAWYVRSATLTQIMRTTWLKTI